MKKPFSGCNNYIYYSYKSLKYSPRKSCFLDTSYHQYPCFLKEKEEKKTRVNNVTKRSTVDARNGGAPYASCIAIVPVSDTTPEIFRSIEPRALITWRSVRERLQGVFEQRRQRGLNGGNFVVFRQLEIFPVVSAATAWVPLPP